MPKAVIELNDARPIWRIPDAARARIRAAFPPDWDVVEIAEPADGRADGAGPSSAALAEIVDAEVYFGFGVSAELLRAAPRLRWAHSGTAGIRGSLSDEMMRRPVLLTNSAGVHAAPVAETVLGALLHFARGLDFAVRGQARREWWKAPFDDAATPVAELGSWTVGVFGFGGIGRAVALRAGALGARVLGYKRRHAVPPPGVELLYGEAGFARLLAESDALVLAAAETPITRRRFDREVFGRLKPGAVLVNVARGALIEQPALLEALRSGRLRGAALDVFAIEPLPPDDPLWDLEGVLVTPHVSAYSRGFWRRETSLIEDNVERFLAGRPLRNVVDKEAGY
ncbi:MAG: D-2-hydroxyacid dehydrogenase [Longimicrobiales bacterium]